MKGILYKSKKIREEQMLWGMIEVGIDSYKSEILVDLDDLVDEQVEAVMKEVVQYDFAITRNFSTSVAEACHRVGVPYISWCYDSPVMALYRPEALYDTNVIFAFDKQQYNRLRAIGISNVYYQPLVANMAKASAAVITDEDIARLKCDISFVGKLYNNDHYERMGKNLSAQAIDDLEKLYNDFLCNWEADGGIFNKLKDETIDDMYNYMSKENLDNYNVSKRFVLENIVPVLELTSRERVTILGYAGDNYNTVIHTYDPEKYREKLSARLEPPVKNLSDELYRIYASATINLNITMRGIESGLPQRIYDIMSVGGCVMSNYQSEACELFVPEKEIILFKSFDEYKDKLAYYLKHEQQCLEIGARGYLKCRDLYNYPNAIRNMIEKL